MTRTELSTSAQPQAGQRSNFLVRRVAVLGAGVMGAQIAAHLVNAKVPVTLFDLPAKEGPKNGIVLKAIDNLKKLSPAPLGIKDDANLIQAANYEDDIEKLRDCDLVIEAATEDEAIKRKIFAALCPKLPEGVLIATNTSSISVTRLAATTDRPEHFIGMHFMNPVPRMELVELIRGIATDDVMFSAAREFVDSLGKVTAVSEDFPAFIVNRILLPMLNEAVYTLYEGVGTVESIDKAMRLGAHHPMGPLQLADFIGLDTCLAVMQVLYEGLSDSKYRPCPLLVKYVEAGWLGRKTQRGFYDYRGETPVPTR